MSGASGPGRALSGFPLTLIAAADEYLLELIRTDAVRAWQDDNPHGEVIQHDVAPPAVRLLQELACPSLFALSRLLVVRDAAAYLDSRKDQRSKEGEALARGLATCRLGADALLLSVIAATPPAGDLPDLVRRQGELRFLPLPEAPKPWENVRVSPAQREVLSDVVRRVAPQVLSNTDALDVLCETYGFRPRELAQAAQRLALGGEVTPEAARAQAGVGEHTFTDIENAVLARSRERLASILAALASGAAMLDWWDEPVAPDRLGAFLGPGIARLLRQALATREHAARANLTGELNVRKCADGRWYGRIFKPSILPRLEKEVAGCDASPLTGLRPWALHRIFRLAAAYRSEELLAALAGLAASGAERLKGRAAITALTPVLIDLVEPTPG